MNAYAVLSMEAGRNVKERGGDNNLIDLIKNDDMFAAVKDRLDEILDAKKFIGRARPRRSSNSFQTKSTPFSRRTKPFSGQRAT